MVPAHVAKNEYAYSVSSDAVNDEVGKSSKSNPSIVGISRKSWKAGWLSLDCDKTTLEFYDESCGQDLTALATVIVRNFTDICLDFGMKL